MELLSKAYSAFVKIFARDIELFSNTNFTNEIIHLLPAIFSIIAITGFSLHLKKIIKTKNFFLSFFLCLIFIGFIQFISFNLGIFWETKFILLVLGYLLLLGHIVIYAKNYIKQICGFFTITARSIPLVITNNIIVATNIVLIFIPFYVFVITQNLGMYGYDTFIFHGLFSKHINEFGNYWTSESVVNLDNLSNVPFFYLLQNFFMDQGLFSERIAVFSNNLFSITGLLALLNATDRNIFKRIIVLILFIILFGMFGHGPLFTLMTEHGLAITFAFYLYFLSTSRKGILQNILLYSLPITVLMKENFIFLIPMLVLMGTLTRYGKIFEFKSKKYFYDVVVPILIILLSTFLIYALHQFNIDQQVITRSPTDLINEYEKFYMFPETARNIFNAMIFRNVIIQGDLNNYWGFFNSNITLVYSSSLALLILLYAQFYFQSTKKTYLSINQLILIGSFISYFIFLMFTFVFAMGEYDNSILASFERYMSVFFLGFILFSVSSANIIQNSGVKIRLSEALFGIMIPVLFVTNGLFSTYFFVANNPDIQFVQSEKNVVNELAMNLNQFDPEKTHKNIVVIFETDRMHALKWSVLRFYLAPHRDLKLIKLNMPTYEELNKTILENADILITEDLSSNNEAELYKLTDEKSFINSKLNICIISSGINIKFRC